MRYVNEDIPDDLIVEEVMKLDPMYPREKVEALVTRYAEAAEEQRREDLRAKAREVARQIVSYLEAAALSGTAHMETPK